MLRPRAWMSEATPAKTQGPGPTHRLAGRVPASAQAPFSPFAHPPTLPRPARGRAGLRGAPAATRARARAIFLSDRPHAFRWRDFSRRKTRAYGTKSGFSSSGSIFRIAESISNPDWTPPETDVIQVEGPWNPFRGRSDARHPDRAAGGAAGTTLASSVSRFPLPIPSECQRAI